jgi:hypothetical protein
MREPDAGESAFAALKPVMFNMLLLTTVKVLLLKQVCKSAPVRCFHAYGCRHDIDSRLAVNDETAAHVGITSANNIVGR